MYAATIYDVGGMINSCFFFTGLTVKLLLSHIANHYTTGTVFSGSITTTTILDELPDGLYGEGMYESAEHPIF